MGRPPFTPVRRIDGYLPLEDHGLIGNGATAALVGRDGSVSWLCAPRFDSPPLFCAILDRHRGGAFAVHPERLTESRQFYEGDTGVLVTEMRGDSAVVRVTDALALRSGADLAEDAPAARPELLRLVEVLQGPVRLQVQVEPRGGAEAEERAGGLRLQAPMRPELDLQLSSTAPLQGLRSTLSLREGERLGLLLSWGGSPSRHRPIPFEQLMAAILEAWSRWIGRFRYEGPQEPLVRRSAITLKLLDHFQNGAIMAAPTSSLPEAIGGRRNWDYRYSWIRDAAFSVYAMRRIGLRREAAGFLSWVLDAVERSGRPRVLYDLQGHLPPKEQEDPHLEGYRRSWPVRWGNAAVDQYQGDAYGEILDCAYQWASGGGPIEPPLWEQLRELVEAAQHEWNKPGQGIWEVRTPGRPFTYSAALCQVALDRGARIAEHLGLSGDVKTWRKAAGQITEVILEQAWNEAGRTFSAVLGGDQLDASLLALPIRRVLPADHPKMVATTKAIATRLDAGGGLLYRYLPEELPDGLPPGEGAFLLCSFWMVDNLAHQGRVEEAMELYESLCGRANPLGLLPEQIDPASGTFLGNYPQAFSHVGLISSGFELGRKTGQIEKRTWRTSPSWTG
ncbi:MAG: glycoside hydrolase family 15 protein [Actinomycetota bacterium]|nr:glycoside hydrolase family 15 protein [Actinomycetota bacterium]